ncbi:unnamed protein product [Notodromas monacha]|uniref:Peptidase S1 domain-containing protein n=1 Tax=Notodromas monacha TaxID=399045 RepID=A0A7R9GC03_9CRUS|nr:unnamed protein product [Notodromas monacha]CAG0915341.1 unnamed protein product [Notodromas monacha]
MDASNVANCDLSTETQATRICLKPSSSATQQTACFGDLGGPVVSNGELIAVISYVPGLLTCQSSDYAVGTLVGAYTKIKIFRIKYKSWVVTLGDLTASKPEDNEQRIDGVGYSNPFYPSVYSGSDPKDIGLVKLKVGAVTDNTNVKTIALSTDTLHYGTMEVTNVAYCGMTVEKTTRRLCLTPSRTTTKQSACFGDLGGPVVYNNQLIAIMTYIPGTISCQATDYTIGVLIGPQSDWIKKFT